MHKVMREGEVEGQVEDSKHSSEYATLNCLNDEAIQETLGVSKAMQLATTKKI